MLHGLLTHSFKNSAPYRLVSVPAQKGGPCIEGLLHSCLLGLTCLSVDPGVWATGLGGSDRDHEQVSCQPRARGPACWSILGPARILPVVLEVRLLVPEVAHLPLVHKITLPCEILSWR